MKRKYVCVFFTLCLALSVAGCGDVSEEQKTANNNQNEFYGEDEEEPSDMGEDHEEIEVKLLPEFVNSEWFDEKVQIYDMVFNNNWYMTEEEIRKIVEGSAYNVELTEDFDGDGNIRLGYLLVDGREVARFDRYSRGYNFRKNFTEPNDLVNYGLLNDGYYYLVNRGSDYIENNWYNKESTEFEDFKTRDDVLAYLAENQIREVGEELVTTYRETFDIESSNYSNYRFEKIFPEDIGELSTVFVDIPHYYCHGVQRIRIYRIHKVSETDQVVEQSMGNRGTRYYSGAHLNLVNYLTFDFNTDGTIALTTQSIRRVMIMGEQICW